MSEQQVQSRVQSVHEAQGRLPNVPVAPTPRAPARRDSPALFKRRQVTQYRSLTDRGGALLLWVVSVVGAVLWGGGGWTAWSSLNPHWPLAALALVVQLITSWFQIVGSARWRSVQYLAPLALSAAMTLLGYLPLIYLGLVLWFGVQAWTPWWWAANVAVFVAAVAIDVVPERTFLED